MTLAPVVVGHAMPTCRCNPAVLQQFSLIAQWLYPINGALSHNEGGFPFAPITCAC